eukprot:gnl/TRDRNA2_/TRDRNA2_164494_c0_seq2.p1 gnl/TRDRNA2_/TRDRNA2_164494_c0~~gnl/TRDRNA2_/TRDRNA2_164494_c0_seq2.p1  ORF type:complete len:352 (+),score=69.86 gnl/TRDRNA2_/TRDRNA2_164494_c0_seq2:51-1106(+)
MARQQLGYVDKVVLDTDRRMAEDGQFYTKADFLQFYGKSGIDEWNAAAPMNSPELSGMLAENAQPEERLQALSFLAAYLRDGDLRLVRPFPEKRTSQRQQEVAKSGLLPSILNTFKLHDWHAKASAAEVVHLLCTSCPQNRDALGEAGVVTMLVPLLHAGAAQEVQQEDDAVRACEEAGEALWMLAYAGADNTGRNHTSGLLHTSDVMDALANVVTNGKSCKAKMWACGALGNLTTDYQVVPREISEQARQQVMKRQGLIEELVQLASTGPVRRSTPADRWPGSTSCKQRHANEIVAWGAMMALKSIALSATSHALLHQSGALDVARRHSNSPDWLEQMKGQLLLRNMGTK